MGPLPLSQGFSYLQTMIDCTTQWLEVAPLAWNPVFELLFLPGSQGSVFRPSSLPTEEPSLPPPSGPESVPPLGSQPLQ